MKKSQIQYKTAKDLLTSNKKVVLDTLNTKFCFEAFSMKDLATDYFNFIQESHYKDSFTCIIAKKDVARYIEISIENFKKQYKSLNSDFNKINDFKEERQKAMWASKSM